MDPTATWTLLLQALIDDDWEAAVLAAETLQEWLQRGGFAPLVASRFPQDHPFHRTLVLTVCNHILQISKQDASH